MFLALHQKPQDLLGKNHEHPWIYFDDDIIRWDPNGEAKTTRLLDDELQNRGRAVLQLLGYRCQIERLKPKD